MGALFMGLVCFLAGILVDHISTTGAACPCLPVWWAGGRRE